jgi:3-methyladenine DNA glycosylase AlkD
MTTKEVLTKLEALGSESAKKIHLKHGAREPFFGVKVGDLKKLQKELKNNQALAMELYETGNSDAMYLAGLMADGSAMTKQQLQSWAEKAYWHMLSEYVVPWVTSESPYGHDLAMKWIDDKRENMAAAGWSTLAGLVAIKDDKDLDIKELQALLDRVQKTIHTSANRVRYTMNNFVIAVGGYVAALTGNAMETGKKIGMVQVDMGDTACQVPFAPDYIKKMKDKGYIGKKRKTIKC